MVHANLHNVLMVGSIAVIFILILKMLGRTRLASVPVVGDALKVAQAA